MNNNNNYVNLTLKRSENSTVPDHEMSARG